MASVTVKIEDNSAAWLQRQTITMQGALRRMGMAIINLAEFTVPKDEDRLAESGHIEGIGNTIYCVYGDNSVRYAGAQEAGYRTGKNGERIVFKNYSTPGTGPHYLKNSGETVVKKGIKQYL